MAIPQQANNTKIARLGASPALPLSCEDISVVTIPMSKGISPLSIFSLMSFAMSTAKAIITYKHAAETNEKIAPLNLLFKKKCPQPGKTKADNKAAFVALRIYNP